MTRKIVLTSILALLSFSANAMQVIMENGCPVDVDPGGNACPGNSGDACYSKGAVVRWSADGQIDEVFKKGGSAELHNCGSRGPMDYQCIIRGNQGDYVDYGIVVDGCALDPRIIIR